MVNIKLFSRVLMLIKTDDWTVYFWNRKKICELITKWLRVWVGDKVKEPREQDAIILIVRGKLRIEHCTAEFYLLILAFLSPIFCFLQFCFFSSNPILDFRFFIFVYFYRIDQSPFIHAIQALKHFVTASLANGM